MRSTCGDTGLVGSWADSETSIRMPCPSRFRLMSATRSRERSDPGVGELLRALGVPARAVIWMITVSGVCAADVADQGLGASVEAEVVDDERGGLAVLGQHDVRRRARLGQGVVQVVEARVTGRADVTKPDELAA